MKIRTKTIEIEYRDFEPGEKVKGTSRSSLGRSVYEVERTVEPDSGCPYAIVFLAGVAHGQDAEHLIPAPTA